MSSRTQRLALGLALLSSLAFGVAAGFADEAPVPVVDQTGLTGLEPAPVEAPNLAIGHRAAEPESIFTTKAGRFEFDDNWERECNIGVLVDCDGALIVRVGSSDDADWTGWDDLDGKWIRAYGELTLLPSECGIWFDISQPWENVRTITDPCTEPNPKTATPGGNTGGGGLVHQCTGSAVTSVFTVRSGPDDGHWSREQGLDTTGPILSFGGNQVFHPIVGLRYRGVTIPKNALISSARVKVAPAANSNIDVDMDVFGDDIGNAPAWGSHHMGNAPRTTAMSVWPIRGQWTGSREGTCSFVTTSQLAPPVQEVIDRSDWASGNALSLLFEWSGPFAEASQRPARSFEGGCAPQLTITWCPAVLVSATSTPVSVRTSTQPANATSPKPTSTPTRNPSQTASATVLPSRTPSVTSTTAPTSTCPPEKCEATPTEVPPVDTPTDTSTPERTASPTNTVPASVPTNTSTATVVAGPTNTPLPPNWCNNPYDLNDDGVIDILDIDIILAAFGSSPGDPNWNPDADVNHDNRVDLLDYLIVREHFGPSCPNPGGGT